jgi:hypothetical protein
VLFGGQKGVRPTASRPISELNTRVPAPTYVRWQTVIGRNVLRILRSSPRSALIEYHRGRVTVLNRKGLEAAELPCRRPTSLRSYYGLR